MQIDQISSALEQSLLSEIEQLARQTSTMQAELARARSALSRYALIARDRDRQREWEMGRREEMRREDRERRRRERSVERGVQTEEEESDSRRNSGRHVAWDRSL